MGYFEGASWCSRQEFEAGKPSRLSENDLYIDELYLFMAAFKGQRAGAEAAITPSRIHTRRPLESGIYLVKFCILDEGTSETDEIEATFQDGLLNDAETGLYSKHGDPVQEAYFKSNNSGIGDGRLRLGTGIEERSLILA